MTSDRITEALSGLAALAAEYDEVFADLVESLGANAADCERDPAQLLPYMEEFAADVSAVDDMTGDDMTDDERVFLTNQFVAYLAKFLIVRHGASWDVIVDDAVPTGFRHVLRLTDVDGASQWADPFRLAIYEFQHLPIEVTRLLAAAQMAAGIFTANAD